MARDVRDALHDAAARPSTTVDVDDLWRRGRRRRLASRFVVVAVVVMFAVGLGAAVVSITVGAGPVPLVGPGPSQPPQEEATWVGDGWPEARGQTLRLGLGEIPEGVSAVVVEDRRAFVVRTGDAVEVFVAAAQHLPNESLWWCPDEQVFVSPYHGELFDRDGRARLGPAHRDLDRLAVEVTGDHVRIDPSSVTVGERAQPADSAEEVLTGAQARAYGQPWGEDFCGGHQPDQESPTVLAPDARRADAPDGARPTQLDDVPPQLRDRFVPDDTDAVFAIDARVAGRSGEVYAAPDTDPPLLFGTSCDLVSSVQLPAGWLGYCLERTDRGQRLSSLFPWGTTSAAVQDRTQYQADLDGDGDDDLLEVDAMQRRVGTQTTAHFPTITVQLASGPRLSLEIDEVTTPDQPWIAGHVELSDDGRDQAFVVTSGETAASLALVAVDPETTELHHVAISDLDNDLLAVGNGAGYAAGLTCRDDGLLESWQWTGGTDKDSDGVLERRLYEFVNGRRLQLTDTSRQTAPRQQGRLDCPQAIDPGL